MRFLALLLALLLPGMARATTIERVVSAGGIEAWLVQVPQIPMLALEASFRGAGSASDPAARSGLANLAAGLLDEGAGPLDSQAFHARLEDLAIRLSFDASRDALSASLRTLTRQRDEAFRLLGLALAEPRFEAADIARVRGQVEAEVIRRAEDPRTVAALAWFETAFPNHPYARPVQGTLASLPAIGRQDLVRFARERLARRNLIIGVVGDVGPAELGRLLDSAFGSLAAAPVGSEAPEAAIAASGTTVIRKQVPQSAVMFGLAGPKRDDRDWYAAYVMNYVLGGGGFKSRLIEEVREKRGLAYSIYSYLQPLQHAGIWLGGVGTQNARVAESLTVIRNELRRMAEHGITDQELAEAKTFLNGSFPMSLDSNSRIAGLLVQLQRDKLGSDHLDKRAQYIDAVTIDDVRRVARRILDPDRLLTVVVGEPAGLGG